MKISKELYTFFKEWLEWAEGGGKDHEVFQTHVGLCSNLDWWHGDSSMGESCMSCYMKRLVNMHTRSGMMNMLT